MPEAGDQPVLVGALLAVAEPDAHAGAASQVVGSRLLIARIVLLGLLRLVPGNGLLGAIGFKGLAVPFGIAEVVVGLPRRQESCRPCF